MTTEERDEEASRSGNSSSSNNFRERIREFKWASLVKMSKQWLRNPLNMALFLWILVVAVSGAILFMVMTGMLNAVLPKKSQRDVWFEVNNQILNALFTLMCLYQHPKRFHHLVLLCRWKQEDDVTALRKIYCEKGTHKPNERFHMMVVVLLLHLNCFAQYALCGLNLGFRRSERPPVGVGICVSVAIAAPAVAGLYTILSPLGKEYGDEENQMDRKVSLERRYSFASRGDDESDLEWRGGVLDIWEDIKVSYLSLLCTFCVFGWNMERIGFGNMYVHIATFVLFCLAPFFIFNLAAINIDNEVVREGLGYMGIVLCVFGLLYGGFWRIQMRKRFKLPGYSFCCGRPAVADCTLWLFCCWCSLAQEVRTANAYEIVEDKLCKRREEEVKAEDSSPGLDSEVVLVSVDGHILTAPVSAEEQEAENLRLNTPQFHLAPGDGTEFCEGSTEFASSETSWDTEFISKVESSNAVVNIKSKKVDIGCVECNDENAKSEEAASTLEVQNLKEGELVPTTIKESVRGEDEVAIVGSCLEKSEPASIFEIQNLKEGELVPIETVTTLVDGSESSTTQLTIEEVRTSEESNTELECEDEETSPSAETAILIENKEGEIIESEERVSVDSTREEDEQLTPSKEPEEDNENKNTTESVAETSNIARSETELKYELSLCKDELRQGMGLTAAAEVFNTHLISTEEYKNSATSILESENLVVRIRETYMPWKKAARIVLGKVVFDLDLEIQPEDVISVEETKPKDDETAAVTTTPSSSGRRWRLWPIPFRRVKTVEHTTSSNSSSEEDLFVDSEPGLQNSPEVLSTNESPRRQLVRTNVPTNEQIASLNLKDGQNMITFSFSTRVLGTQQVDAHIYRWRWDTKIVISDVDGTITKSDVLGQFMPLVGRDWTQSGVAKLFSAIKENGYQLLFLSARAIVQAYLTRSFLNNLKQDGKALPNGPVVISPDGLFPALYREVIRRAPHEFKIACLEDIKKLFPEHYNPFYAGFGNRDTDELSYSKLGIPKGKIFIINPKGEVATGHRVDVKKSYTSLHTLVNDMFPPTSLVEQEDYNPWNFWKLPIEEVD